MRSQAQTIKETTMALNRVHQDFQTSKVKTRKQDEAQKGSDRKLSETSFELERRWRTCEDTHGI